jgi:hypothetical protein
LSAPTASRSSVNSSLSFFIISSFLIVRSIDCPIEAHHPHQILATLKPKNMAQPKQLPNTREEAMENNNPITTGFFKRGRPFHSKKRATLASDELAVWCAANSSAKNTPPPSQAKSTKKYKTYASSAATTVNGVVIPIRKYSAGDDKVKL